VRKSVALITGAAGEIGRALIDRISGGGDVSVVTLDLKPLDESIARRTTRMYTGSITDRELLDRILAEFEVDRIYHLAALLSTRAEFTPVTAHQVNVDGTLALLEFAQSQGRSHGRTVTFFYPSSIAAYGVSLDLKESASPLSEHEWNQPITMYGCNKLYCEHLGRYYDRHYRQLDADRRADTVDFRSLRFPGLISAVTIPSGGTSDYLPEMIHAAARGLSYDCFVRPDTRIPFMVMPDAVDAVLALMSASRKALSRSVYNVSAFNPSAAEFGERLQSHFPDARLSFIPDTARQAIVDSWPAAVNDDAARRDWGFDPEHGLDRALDEYLVPTIRRSYRKTGKD
jgi:nucleoside-diphosphate-sugar epimerase